MRLTAAHSTIELPGNAAEPGFEPGLKDPKSSVLPLHNSALNLLDYFQSLSHLVQVDRPTPAQDMRGENPGVLGIPKAFPPYHGPGESEIIGYPQKTSYQPASGLFPASHLPLLFYPAEGRIRTDTGVASQQFLRLPRLPFRHFGICCAEEQNRTADTRIFSPLLYP